MQKFYFTMKSAEGIHSRPAGQLVRLADLFKSDIHITKENRTVNAKHIFSVIALGIGYDDKICITIVGEDELLAREQILDFLKSL